MSQGERQRIFEALVADRIYRCGFCGRRWGVKYLKPQPRHLYDLNVKGGMCPGCFWGKCGAPGGKHAEVIEFLMDLGEDE